MNDGHRRCRFTPHTDYNSADKNAETRVTVIVSFTVTYWHSYKQNTPASSDQHNTCAGPATYFQSVQQLLTQSTINVK